MILFGIRFLDSYYQVFDMQRNQMALAVNKYSQLASPVIQVRDHMQVVLPASSVSLLAILFLIMNRKILNLEKDKDLQEQERQQR